MNIDIIHVTGHSEFNSSAGDASSERLLIVGWQATQKCSFEYILKEMDFFFTTFLFDV